MADLDFEVTDGPYAARYSLNWGDLTASDIGDVVAAGGPDLDAILFTKTAPMGTRGFAALVWIVKRRANKGLAYRMVADTINPTNVRDVEEPDAAGTAGLPDPSSSADAS